MLSRKTRIRVFVVVLVLVVVGTAVWRILNSKWYAEWQLDRLMRIMEESLEAGSDLEGGNISKNEINLGEPVLEEDGRFIRPAKITFKSSKGVVLTKYDLVVFDDRNGNETHDPDEPSWTWYQEDPLGLPANPAFCPRRLPISPKAQTVHFPRFELEIINSRTTRYCLRGIVEPSTKSE